MPENGLNASQFGIGVQRVQVFKVIEYFKVRTVELMNSQIQQFIAGKKFPLSFPPSPYPILPRKRAPCSLPGSYSPCWVHHKL